jgi:hypothetical protein
MEALLTSTDCCNRCDDDPVIENIPGGNGQDGQDGAPGDPGENAYTTLTAGFTMPEGAESAHDGEPAHEGRDVTIDVVSTEFMVQRQGAVLGQILYIQHAGYMEVREIVSPTKVKVRNISNAAEDIYPQNAPEGANIPANARVSPGGIQGPKGLAPDDALLRDENLQDLEDPIEARENLGLGTSAVLNAGKLHGNVALVDDDPSLTAGEVVFATAAGITSKPNADVHTALGIKDMAFQESGAVHITGGSATLSTPLGVDSGGTGRDNLPDFKKDLGMLSGYGLLGVLNVDLATAADTPIPMVSTRYRIDKITLENPSSSSGSLVGSVTLGVYTAASGGTTLADNQSLNDLNATNKFMDMTLQAIVGTDVRTEPQLSARVAAPMAGASVSLRIFGWSFLLKHHGEVG